MTIKNWKRVFRGRLWRFCLLVLFWEFLIFAGRTPPGNFSCYAQESGNNIRTLLSGEGKVVFGNEPNSIIVIDYPENIERVADYLEKLDTPPAQVLIEARIVEVKLQKEHALGVNWKAFADKGYFPIGRFKTGISAGLGNPPAPFQQTISYKPTFFPPAQTSAGQESPFTFAIFDDNISIVLQTLASALNTNVLSAPKVTTVNNREAEIKVIQRLPWAEPNVTVDSSGSVVVTWKINFEEVGIALKVTPLINENGDVTMVLNPDISEKTSDYSLTVTQGTTSVPYTVPIIDRRSASTKVIVGNGQTLIIGGLIKDKITKGETKIPILGDLPYLGYLFKSKKDIHDKTELLIFVSPKIITSDDLIHMEKEEKGLWDKNYSRQRQLQKLSTLTREEEKKTHAETLDKKISELTEKQKSLAEKRKKMESDILKEEQNLRLLQSPPK